MTLKERWDALRTENGGLRIRDAAARLGVSEAALLETRLGAGVTRLRADPAIVLPALPRLGTVMSLMRNDAAVHEKDAVLAGLTEEHPAAAGPDWRLAATPAMLAYLYDVTDQGPKGPLRSLQYFGADGTALWKIYQRAATDAAAFESLVTELRLDETGPTPFPAAGPSLGALATTAPSLQPMLEAAVQASLPISVTVFNAALRQAFDGPIRRVVRMGSWLNILDPGFDWHLDESRIARLDAASEGKVQLIDAHGATLVEVTVGAEATPAERQAFADLVGSLEA